MLEVSKLVLQGVVSYLVADWPILLLGIVLAVVMRVYFDAARIQKLLQGNARISIFGSVGVGALTPLCACGTMGVIISLFVAQIPWGPVMAFLVTSPLVSPAEFLFNVSFLGTSFAVGLALAGIMLGLLAGFLANWLEQNTNFFAHQFKQTKASEECSCASAVNEETAADEPLSPWERWRLRQLAIAFYDLGIKKVLFYFVIFIAIGQVIQLVVPPELVTRLFGSGNILAIPMAALIGLPFYISGPAALPILRSFVEQGADPSSVLAFVIAGKATGLPVLMGMSIFLKRRTLALYVLVIFLGAIAAGYLHYFSQWVYSLFFI